jgi:release factor glutamine methyltransferase
MQNGVAIDTVRTNLVDAIMPRLKQKIDVLCFNPPYVVTPTEEVGSVGIEASWAGGVDGREVIDQLLPLITVSWKEEGIRPTL